MAIALEDELVTLFPRLRRGEFKVTSPPDVRYNCIAWAAGDNTRWWEPDAMGVCYWPPGAPREYTLEAYKKAFVVLGFSQLRDSPSVECSQRIALYAAQPNPQVTPAFHAARQVTDRRWTSKLGRSVDIEHLRAGLCGDTYGEVVATLGKPFRGTADISSPLHR